MKKLITSILLVSSVSAFADTPLDLQPIVNATATAINNNNAAASSGTTGSQTGNITQPLSNQNLNSNNGITSTIVNNTGSGTNSGTINNTNATTTGSDLSKSVPNTYSPNLTSGFDTCLGSSSGGGSLAGFGLSFGTTRVDENCVAIKQAKALNELGLKEASLERLKQDPRIKEAVEKAYPNTIRGTQFEFIKESK